MAEGVFAEKSALIAGGGLVGSLFSIYLQKMGFRVTVIEKRPDYQAVKKQEGRSINLALSHRGWKALKKVGIEQEIKDICVAMEGRFIHLQEKDHFFQPYSNEDKAIYSISRLDLNKFLVEKAKNEGVKFYFESELQSVNFDDNSISCMVEGETLTVAYDLLIGADGANSMVRRSMEQKGYCSSNTDFLSHSYKEIDITKEEGRKLEPKNALHIWPRGNFMSIALPNTDGSFTGTLFLANEGEESFASWDEETVSDKFKTYFPDLYEIKPDIGQDYLQHEQSMLGTLYCDRWNYKNVLLIGDAAHAIVPFYGQGMNAGFEDCRLLSEFLKENSGDLPLAMALFATQRKEDADAIAELAMINFIEMRDKVADPDFQLMKSLDEMMSQVIGSWMPIYSMVTFSDMSYSDALKKRNERVELLTGLLKNEKIRTAAKEKKVTPEISSYLKQILQTE